MGTKLGMVLSVTMLVAAVAVAGELTEDQIYLFQVCESGDAEEARRLLGDGVDPKCRDDFGFTPLILAGQAAEPKLIRLLLAAGCDPRATADDGINPLLAVVHSCGQMGPEEPDEQRGFIDSAKLLIEAGTPVNARDGEGRTALAIARHYKDDTLVETLIAAGAVE